MRSKYKKYKALFIECKSDLDKVYRMMIQKEEKDCDTISSLKEKIEKLEKGLKENTSENQSKGLEELKQTTAELYRLKKENCVLTLQNESLQHEISTLQIQLASALKSTHPNPKKE